MEIKRLTTLRGIAALTVAVSHYSNQTNLLDRLLGKGAGQIGVMLFFILSGFLLSHLYMHRQANRFEVRKFIIARIARVLPLYFLVVLFSFVLSKAGVVGVLYHIPDGPSLLSHLAFLSGEYVLWTIPVEIQFYLLFIVFWWIFKKQEKLLYCLLGVLLLSLWQLGFPGTAGRIFGIPYSLLLGHSLPYFLVGVLLGRLYSIWQPPRYLSRNIFVLTLLIIPLVFPKVFFLVTGFEHGMWKDAGILAAVSLVFFCITFLVPKDNALLSNRIGDFLGKISYSLYLLHAPILIQFKGLAVRSPGVFLSLYLMISIGISFLSYWLLESRARQAIRAWGR